jgi:hypothetical protein
LVSGLRIVVSPVRVLGLAIARNTRWLRDFELSGVLDASLDLGLGSPDLGLAG